MANTTPRTGENLEIVHLPELTTGEREVVLVTHDESTFYCNKGLKLFWMENGKKKLLPSVYFTRYLEYPKVTNSCSLRYTDIAVTSDAR